MFCRIKCEGECTYRGADKRCVYEYDPADYKPEHRWLGDGDPPPRWIALDGTLVYRTFADYCDH